MKLLLPALLVALAQGAAAQGGAVQATVTGIRASQRGTLLVALYRGEPGWLVLDSALAVRRLAVATDSVTVTFEALSPGTDYAIAVIHDRNGNDRIDMRWFPIPRPREGAGVSGNHLRMGKPRFDPAAFVVADTLERLRIAMRY